MDHTDDTDARLLGTHQIAFKTCKSVFN
jgi:hypothetical protein